MPQSSTPRLRCRGPKDWSSLPDRALITTRTLTRAPSRSQSLVCRHPTTLSRRRSLTIAFVCAAQKREIDAPSFQTMNLCPTVANTCLSRFPSAFPGDWINQNWVPKCGASCTSVSYYSMEADSEMGQFVFVDLLFHQHWRTRAESKPLPEDF